ncbi:MAG: hypothetical protein AAGF96_09095 [Bacteroidota bacterium]
MKRKDLIVGLLSLIIGVFFTNCDLRKTETGIEYNTQTFTTDSKDPIFRYPEKSIKESLTKALQNGNTRTLSILEGKLQDEYQNKNVSLSLYWMAYLKYVFSQYYTKNNENDSAKNAVLKGMQLLEKIDIKNSDDYALLAMLEGAFIQYLQNQDIVLYNIKAKNNIKKALALDSTNIRAHFVAANHDLHTPKVYGGGKIAEKHLKKVINSSPKEQQNAFAPSWGRKESYALLIAHYNQQNENKKEAEVRKSFQKDYQKIDTVFRESKLLDLGVLH